MTKTGQYVSGAAVAAPGAPQHTSSEVHWSHRPSAAADRLPGALQLELSPPAIHVRGIAPEELRAFSAFSGGPHYTFAPSCPAAFEAWLRRCWETGNSRPEWCFVAGATGDAPLMTTLAPEIEVTPDALAAILARHHLAPSTPVARMVSTGIVNTIYAVGSDLVLRVPRAKYGAYIKKEAKVVPQARAAGVRDETTRIEQVVVVYEAPVSAPAQSYTRRLVRVSTAAATKAATKAGTAVAVGHTTRASPNAPRLLVPIHSA